MVSFILVVAVAAMTFFLSSRLRNQSSNSPIISPSPSPSSNEGFSNEDLEEFSDRLKSAWDQIPTLVMLQQLPQEEIHQTPRAVLQAANELGDLNDYVEKHPEYSWKAAEFFKNCALNQEFPPSIRAICFSDFQYTSVTRLKQKSPDLEVGDTVKKLASRLALHTSKSH